MSVEEVVEVEGEVGMEVREAVRVEGYEVGYSRVQSIVEIFSCHLIFLVLNTSHGASHRSLCIVHRYCVQRDV